MTAFLIVFGCSVVPSVGGSRITAGPSSRKSRSRIHRGTRAVVSVFHPMSMPSRIGAPSGIRSFEAARCHSASLIAASALRVGRLHLKRAQCESVMVGELKSSRSVFVVTPENGFACFTTAMSVTSAFSGTAQSCSTIVFAQARMKLPRRVTPGSCRIFSRVSSKSL